MFRLQNKNHKIRTVEKITDVKLYTYQLTECSIDEPELYVIK